MILIFSMAVAFLFAAGVYLLLKRDLIRVMVGVILISNAASLFLMSAAITRGRVPIYPLSPGQSVADPVVQSLTLTSIVITFGVSAVLLGLVYRVYTSHGSIDLDDLTRAELAEQGELADGEDEAA